MFTMTLLPVSNGVNMTKKLCNSRIPPQALIHLLSVPEKAMEAKAMAEQGVAMAKDKCKVQ